MNKYERAKMVLAMEYIARQVSDEEIFEGWLINGVADGDIPYGYFGELDQFTARDLVEDNELYIYFEEDDSFAELMDLFLRLMCAAKKSGGLYCDGIISKED